MNSRIAKKVLGYMIADPSLKPSAQTPYRDPQILAASRTYRKSLRRWKRATEMNGRAKWCPPYRRMGKQGTRQSLKRGPVFS